MKPLHIWSNHHFSDADAAALQDRIRPHTITWAAAKNASNLVPGQPDSAAADADVLYGQPAPDDVLTSKNVRWVQLSSAGYTRYDSKDFLTTLKARDVAFCNASSLFEEPCAQHALAMLMAAARGLPHAFEDQPHHRWDTAAHRKRSFLLRGQKTLLVGYGAIARRLAELLNPFALDLVAFRRRPRGDENVKTLPIDEADAHLPAAEIVFNILPLSDSTRNFFNQSRFEKMHPQAVYISIGRGDTTDQPALINALHSGKLSRAYLDVTTPEPLPPDHALWSAPRCSITPHTAGGTRDEPQRLIEHFVANLNRFANGQPLVDRVV